MSCAICNTRKEKRFCPAIHGRICPQCCGEQRELTLDCPSDCSHLRQARDHERPRQIGDLEQIALFPQVEITQQFLYEHEHLIMGLYFALANNTRGNPQVKDPDLIAALTALARKYETLVNSGLHYEAPIAGLMQQAIISEIQNMVKEYRETEQQHLGYSRLRDHDVLRALVFMVRMGHARTNGRPKSRAFAESAIARFPGTEPVLTERAPGSLIIP